MLLPTPIAEEVVRFQALYKKQYGADLPGHEAQAMLTRLVQFYYLTGGHNARRLFLEQKKQENQKINQRAQHNQA